MVDKEIKFEDYSEDVQKWILHEQACAKFPCYKNEIFKNSQGFIYEVIKDAPAGQVNVWVKFKDKKIGMIAKREIPKAVMLS